MGESSFYDSMMRKGAAGGTRGAGAGAWDAGIGTGPAKAPSRKRGPGPKGPSDKVLGNRRARVVFNRAALEAAELGIADGLYELGLDLIADASLGPKGGPQFGPGSLRDPETAEERGVAMMLDTGWVKVWVNGVNVSIDAPTEAKPRDLALPYGQVVMVAAFASRLAHLQELGTVKMNAHPFLTPAFNRALPNTAEYVVPAMGKRIAAAPEESSTMTGLKAALAAELARQR